VALEQFTDGLNLPKQPLPDTTKRIWSNGVSKMEYPYILIKLLCDKDFNPDILKWLDLEKGSFTFNKSHEKRSILANQVGKMNGVVQKHSETSHYLLFESFRRNLSSYKDGNIVKKIGDQSGDHYFTNSFQRILGFTAKDLQDLLNYSAPEKYADDDTIIVDMLDDTSLPSIMDMWSDEEKQHYESNSNNFDPETSTRPESDEMGQSLLHLAAKYGDVKNLKRMMTSKVFENTLDDKSKFGRTALHYAASSGNGEILKLLSLKSLKSLNEPDLLGMTPLHWAVKNNHKRCIKMLLDYSADHSAKNDFGMDALDEYIKRAK